MRDAELSYLEDRTVSLLAGGPLTVKELARELGVAEESARAIAKGLVGARRIGVDYISVGPHPRQAFSGVRKAVYRALGA